MQCNRSWTRPIIVFINFYFIFFRYEATMASTTLGVVVMSDPKIVYMDGQSKWDSCVPGLKRSVNAESGLLISHSAYGTHPYNVSKNCFLTINVPLGYRIRLKALDFDVFGERRRCAADTLHVFDHSRPNEDLLLSGGGGDASVSLVHHQEANVDEHPSASGGRLSSLIHGNREGGSGASTLLTAPPGRLLGEFCGRIVNNASRNEGNVMTATTAEALLVESTHNTLTLWWHTGGGGGSVKPEVSQSSLPLRRHNEGFRLLWSAFRTIQYDDCRNGAEFRCASGAECLPLSLGCNSYADCADSSDLDADLRLRHMCKNVPTLFSGLTGAKKLLLCVTLALGVACTCFLCCACVHVWRKNAASGAKKTATSSASSSSLRPPPSSAAADSSIVAAPAKYVTAQQQYATNLVNGGATMMTAATGLSFSGSDEFCSGKIEDGKPPPSGKERHHHHHRTRQHDCMAMRNGCTQASAPPSAFNSSSSGCGDVGMVVATADGHHQHRQPPPLPPSFSPPRVPQHRQGTGNDGAAAITNAAYHRVDFAPLNNFTVGQSAVVQQPFYLQQQQQQQRFQQQLSPPLPNLSLPK